MVLLNFHNKFHVELSGEGITDSGLLEYYKRFVTEKKVQPDFRCEITDVDPILKATLGGPDQYYGVSDEGFVIKPEYGGKAIIDDSWSKINFSRDSNKWFMFGLIEFVVRKRFSFAGAAMIHASGVKIDGKTLVFPAWRHTGKTNTMLTLLSEGASYLSDDRLWITKEGAVLGHPVPINMLPYNYDSFPGLQSEARFRTARRRVSELIHDMTAGKESFMQRALYFTNELYFKPSNNLCTADELYPETEYVSRADIDAIVLLQTSDEGEMSLSEMESGFTDAMTAINYYEWNKKLENHVRAQRLLNPDSEALSEMLDLLNKEADIFASVGGTVPIYKLQVPRESEWTEEGVVDALRASLAPIFES